MAAQDQREPSSPSTPGWTEVDRPQETVYIEGIGEMRKARPKPKVKAKAAAADPPTRMGPDVRDPRYLGEGPCANHHQEYYQGGNPHGTWKHCQRCDLRVEYVAKNGSTAGSTKTHNPERVRAAFLILQKTGQFENGTFKEFRAAIKIAEELARVKPETMSKDILFELMREELGEANANQQRKPKAKDGYKDTPMRQAMAQGTFPETCPNGRAPSPQHPRQPGTAGSSSAAPAATDPETA